MCPEAQKKAILKDCFRSSFRLVSVFNFLALAHRLLIVLSNALKPWGCFFQDKAKLLLLVLSISFILVHFIVRSLSKTPNVDLNNSELFEDIRGRVFEDKFRFLLLEKANRGSKKNFGVFR